MDENKLHLVLLQSVMLVNYRPLYHNYVQTIPGRYRMEEELGRKKSVINKSKESCSLQCPFSKNKKRGLEFGQAEQRSPHTMLIVWFSVSMNG